MTRPPNRNPDYVFEKGVSKNYDSKDCAVVFADMLESTKKTFLLSSLPVDMKFLMCKFYHNNVLKNQYSLEIKAIKQIYFDKLQD